MARSHCLLLLLLSVLASTSTGQKVRIGGVDPMPSSTLVAVRAMMQAYVNDHQVPAPVNVLCKDCLISSWLRHSSFGNYVHFPLSNLQAATASYPSQVQDKIRSLLNDASGSTKFERFSVDIQNTHAQKKSFIGMVRLVNDMVDLAIMEVDIQAALVQKYETLSRRVCKKILFVKKCETEYYKAPRDYKADEISAMTKTLESEAFKMFQNLLARIAEETSLIDRPSAGKKH